MSGCSKREFLPDPELILSLNSSTYNYFGSSSIKLAQNANFSLLGYRGISTGIIPWASDSMDIVYKSFLTDTLNNISALLSITKVYHRNQLDSTSYGWVLKNSDDFFSIFSKGKMNVLSSEAYAKNEGVSFQISTNSKHYHTHPNGFGISHSVIPHLDPSNEFIVEDTHTEINWGALSLTGLLPNIEARKVLVNFSFKAKLINNDNPNDSIIITSGRFQGFFADK